MSTWRVERHYGFGAAQIPISASAHRASKRGTRDGLSTIFTEFAEGGPLSAARRLAGQAPVLMLGLLLFASFAITVLRDNSDSSEIQVVMLQTSPLDELVPVPIPEPEPIPVVKIEEPPPPPVVVPPEPKRIEEPKPQLAEVKRREPKVTPKPKPVMPEIARIEPPASPPVLRPDRPTRDRPQTIERPRMKMDGVAPEPVKPVAPAERLARAAVERPRLARNSPKLAAPAAPAFDKAPAKPFERNFRMAAARPVAGERPRAVPGMAPAPVQRKTAPAAAPSRPSRSAARPARQRSRAQPVAPALAAAPRLDEPAPQLPATNRESRSTPRAETRRGPRPAAAPVRAPKIAPATPPAAKSRIARAAPAMAGAQVTDRPGVAGVPLGDLAACISDREEDRLKQAVVAAVKTQKECVSRKGTYRFIETKNLNAFLMWIDRSPTRAAGDRCTELLNALECLESDGLRAAR